MSKVLRRQGSEPCRYLGEGCHSRGNSQCKGSEAGVLKQQGNECGWSGVKEEKEAGCEIRGKGGSFPRVSESDAVRPR